MTHLLTPREKVQLQCSKCGGADIMLCDCSLPGRTALASGSGDHAELARLADMADWMADGDPGANGSVLLSASVASEHASDLKALLAENAALRGGVRSLEIRRDFYKHNMQRAEARATEAERKLAEADQCARQIVDLQIPPGDDLEQRLKLLSLLAKAQVLARTFLSKEAERG